jgi:hypothetical protein
MSVTRANIDACEWLYLWKICEQRGNAILRIEVAENSNAESPRLFEVTWATYVSYQIGGESMGGDRTDEVFDGTKFRCYTKSPYLDYVATTPTTDVLHAELGGWSRVRHWAIYCLDHTIDVASIDEPQIRLLDPPASWAEERLHTIERKRNFEEILALNRERSILSTLEERMKKT